jgi:hypothetical protein
MADAILPAPINAYFIARRVNLSAFFANFLFGILESIERANQPFLHGCIDVELNEGIFTGVIGVSWGATHILLGEVVDLG